MKSHVLEGSTNIMQLRKVLQFNTSLGLTLPKEYTQFIDIEKGDYIELSLGPGQALTIRKHEKYQPSKERSTYGQYATT